MTAAERCPCGTGLGYADCCGPLHTRARAAGTPEQLMRSRFSAFAVGDAAYLRDTQADTRPTVVLDPDVRWTHLEVLAATGGPFDATGTVEFRAHYRAGAARGAIHEVSRFVREAGRWLYVDGDARP